MISVDTTKDKWVDKFRPQTLDDMILSEDLKKYFQNMVKSRKFVNFSIQGSPGFGKTTLAKALSQTANAEVLFMACASGDGRVDSIQTKLIPFTQSMPMDDRPMFVILDELDSASATSDSSFQKALRNVIEAAPNVVFIATCNYATKIIPAIQSRCPAISLKYTPKDVLIRLKDILDYEKIEYTTNDLKEFVRITVKKFYPDIRSIVNYLQGSCSSGKLIVNANAMMDAERTNFIKDLIDKCMTEKNILNVRKFYVSNKDKIEDFKTMASDIFNYVVDNGVVSDKAMILKLANVFYQLNTVIDPEIQFFAMLTLISQASQTNG